MKRSALATALLLFVVASACGSERLQVTATFEDVGDLVKRAQVQFADVRVGTVQDIELVGYKARVRMSIDPSVSIPANVGAVIRSTSLLGEKFVELQVPTTEAPRGRLRDGAVISESRTELATDLERVLIQLSGILEGGSAGDLAAFISSAAEGVRGKEERLGELFAELRKTTDVLGPNAADIGAAVDGLHSAFDALAGSAPEIAAAIDSSARVAKVVADQQKDLDGLLDALDRFSGVAARYTSSTRPSSDRALKDLRLILDETMKTTSDLDQALSALSRFVDLWPRAIPGDHVQLDVVVHDSNQNPSTSSSAKRERTPAFAELLWGAVR